MYRTTTGIQSGEGDFDKSSFNMTFLTILGIIEVLCSFTLVLEGKTGKVIPEASRLEFLEKFLAKNFVEIFQTILLYLKQKTTPLGH